MRIKHIAFVMDGNGRWAARRGKSRKYGHKKGVEALKRVLSSLKDYGIPVVSFYAFSTENWKRPQDEINALFSMMKEYLKNTESELIKNDIKLNVFGRREGLPDDLVECIDKAEKLTAGCKSHTANLMINYGARAEICDAFKKAAAAGETELTEEKLSLYLYTAGLPDPDIIVRTGGDKRLSNFMLYQGAYSELVFTDYYWPDINKKRIKEIIDEFASRKRRFGALEDVSSES